MFKWCKNVQLPCLAYEHRRTNKDHSLQKMKLSISSAQVDDDNKKELQIFQAETDIKVLLQSSAKIVFVQASLFCHAHRELSLTMSFLGMMCLALVA